jgi:hypothetical protein
MLLSCTRSQAPVSWPHRKKNPLLSCTGIFPILKKKKKKKKKKKATRGSRRLPLSHATTIETRTSELPLVLSLSTLDIRTYRFAAPAPPSGLQGEKVRAEFEG